MRTNLWLEHFRAQTTGLEQKYRNIPQNDLSLLAYSLKSNTIKSTDYLDWAKEQYKLPVISDEFFKQTAPPIEKWKKWKALFKWTSEIQPLGDWDGHLLVGCLEIPAQFPFEHKAIFFLCSIENLANWSQQLQAVQVQPVPKVRDTNPSQYASPIAVDAKVPRVVSKAPTPSAVLVLEESNESETVPIGTENSAAPDKPDGLFETHASFFKPTRSGWENPANNQNDFSVSTSTSIKNESSLKNAIPFEISIKTGTAIDLTKRSVSIKSVAPSEDTGMTAMGLNTAVLDKTQQIERFNTVLTSLTKLEKEMGNLPVDGKSTTDVKAQPKSVEAVVSDKGGEPKYILNILYDRNHNAFVQESRQIFDKMKSHFEKSMVLSLDLQEERLKPYVWGDNFSSNSTRAAEISLAPSSIFKIVAVSQKPFHGSVTLNETNERFFDEWNQGITPAHITMTPIVINNRLIGMIMGLGEKSCYSWSVLKFMENISADFSQKILELVDSAA